MSNSQPAVACGYGVARKEHQHPTTNNQRPTTKFGRLEIPCWILDIQTLEKPDGAREITRPD
jgi:hypothetical protein